MEAIMVRILLTLSLIVTLSTLIGCNNIDAGKGQLLPDRSKVPTTRPLEVVINAAEADLVEQVAINRRIYRQDLEVLVEYYGNAGNNMKLNWARQELGSLNAIPQYRYIIEAEVAGPTLSAFNAIAEADELYADAMRTYKRAKELIVVRDETRLRLALDMFNQLISQYPSSDKIDDAAYNAAQIYEYFKDYSIALLYYQRTYQWDPATPYPARFKAATILDKRFKRKGEALELYKQVVAEEGSSNKYKRYAERRIQQLTKTVPPLEEEY